MSVNLSCRECGKDYSVPKSRANKSRFCSRLCANENQRTSERRDIECRGCGKTFSAKKDHGKWPKFCGRKCFEAGSVFSAPCSDPMVKVAHPKTCPGCQAPFLAKKSSHNKDGLTSFCSKKCFTQFQSVPNAICPNCNSHFRLVPSQRKHGTECCSLSCRREYRRLANSGAWKGGSYVREQTGEQFIVRNPEEEGGIKTYVGMHRVVASLYIGRELMRSEYVIRINNDRLDNSASNLFICGSISEYCGYRDGKRPWPSKSNLETYDTEAETLLNLK